MSSSELADALNMLHTEGGGTLTVVVIRPADIPQLLDDCMAGDRGAITLFHAATQTIQRVADAPRRRPALCAVCPRCVRKRDRFAVAIAFPFRDKPSLGLGMAICHRCDTGGDLQEVALTALRRLWPDLRMVTLTDPIGGHA